jgi:multisubunit Na+/H+ antiporter MnhG subunit
MFGKIVLLVLFVFVTGPTVTYLIANSAIKYGLIPYTRDDNEQSK